MAVGLCVPPLVVFWHSRSAKTVLLCLFAIIIGVGRVNAAFPVVDESRLMFYGDQKITFVGYVAREPDQREDHVRLTIDAEGEYGGRVLVRSGRYPSYSYGDPVEVTCNLTVPEAIEDFRYDRYLRTQKVFMLCQGATVRSRRGEKRGSEIIGHLLSIKQKLQETINQYISEPHASFLGGLLYGLRSTIPVDLQEAFNKTGTTHIIAISGYNITIVVSMVMSALMAMYVSRRHAFWLAVLGVVVFVVLVGAQASVVRAALMGILALSARQLGFLSRPAPLLAAVAFAMVLHNPFILLFDAGFQFSFLAVMGLIYLSPSLARFFTRLPVFIGTILSETLAAIIFTTPIIFYTFERFSVVAPLVNAVILLVVPWVMLVGFVAVILTFIVPIVGQVLFWVTWLLLSYIIVVVKAFAWLPFSSVQVFMPLWLLLLAYVILLYIVFKKTIDHEQEV